MPFKPGDVIIVWFPYRDNPTQGKLRPALVLHQKTETILRVCMITTKNKTGELKGEWIDSGSEEYNAMGLNFPSFINFENILDLPTSLINRNEPIGRYPNIEKLLNIHGINEGS